MLAEFDADFGALRTREAIERFALADIGDDRIEHRFVEPLDSRPVDRRGPSGTGDNHRLVFASGGDHCCPEAASKPGLEVLHKIAKALDVPLAKLLTPEAVPESRRQRVKKPKPAQPSPHGSVLSRYGVVRAWSELLDGHEYAMKSVIQRLRFPLEIMLVCVRWYVAYPLSLRNLEEMMQERGVRVDHSTIHRWIVRLMPVLERAFRQRKATVGTSWRMDETYMKVGGEWKYLYRAVDKAGNTVDFLLSAKRDQAAAQRFLARAH